jgi:hypothetical protein
VPACERFVFQILTVQVKEIEGIKMDVQLARLGVLQRIKI